MTDLNSLMADLAEINKITSTLGKAGVRSDNINLEDRYTNEFVLTMHKLDGVANKNEKPQNAELIQVSEPASEPEYSYAMPNEEVDAEEDREGDKDQGSGLNPDEFESERYQEEKIAEAAKKEEELAKEREKRSEEQEHFASQERIEEIHKFLYALSESEKDKGFNPHRSKLGEFSPTAEAGLSKERGIGLADSGVHLG